MSTNNYLQQIYKETFLADNLVQTLACFFNEKPAEACPTLYKLLLVVLVSPALSLENFKTLLSDIAEVLPCILRQERALLTSALFSNVHSVKVPKIHCYDHKAYIATFIAKLG